MEESTASQQEKSPQEPSTRRSRRGSGKKRKASATISSFEEAIHAPLPEAKVTPAVEVPPPQIMTVENRDRINLGVEELATIIRGVPTLDFLKAKLARAVADGVDYQSLVSFYRITARILREELDKKREQIRSLEEEFEAQRNRVELLKQVASASSPSTGTLVQPRAAQDKEILKEGSGIPPPAHPEVDLEEMENQIMGLRKALEKRDQRIRDLGEYLEHMKGEFERYRSRTNQEVVGQMERVTEELIKKILPVMDNFERALNATRSQGTLDSIQAGVEMIHRQMDEILRKEGVSPIRAQGESFDPRFHEVLVEVPTDEYPEDTVVEEVYKGYLFRSRVLRPTLVKIAKPVAKFAHPENPESNP